jgi:2-phosphoglycerate kinase
MEPDLRNDANSSWRVLLVRGASGVGKTLATQSLAQQLGISHLYVDDIRMAIQYVSRPEQQPALFYFLDAPNIHTGPDMDQV